jgi:hypothetical protein
MARLSGTLVIGERRASARSAAIRRRRIMYEGFVSETDLYPYARDLRVCEAIDLGDK